MKLQIYNCESLGGDYSVKLHMRSGSHRLFHQHPKGEIAGEAFLLGYINYANAKYYSRVA